AISLLTDMVNRPSYNDFTLLENILYSSKRLVETLTMISITAGIRRKRSQLIRWAAVRHHPPVVPDTVDCASSSTFAGWCSSSESTLQPGAELDQEVLQEILPKPSGALHQDMLGSPSPATPAGGPCRIGDASRTTATGKSLREKLKVETERRDYRLEWGDIAFPRNRIFRNKWPKSENGKVYVPYKVSLAFFDGDVKKIEEAALEFKEKTCVRFIPRSNETDYIYIHAWEGTAGSKDEHSPTMLPRDTSTMHRFGGGHTLSDGDVEKIEKMFDSEPAPRQRRGAFLNHQNVSAGAGPMLRDVGVSDYSLVDVVGVWNQHLFCASECKNTKCLAASQVCQTRTEQESIDSVCEGDGFDRSDLDCLLLHRKSMAELTDCKAQVYLKVKRECFNKVWSNIVRTQGECGGAAGVSSRPLAWAGAGPVRSVCRLPPELCGVSVRRGAPPDVEVEMGSQRAEALLKRPHVSDDLVECALSSCFNNTECFHNYHHELAQNPASHRVFNLTLCAFVSTDYPLECDHRNCTLDIAACKHLGTVSMPGTSTQAHAAWSTHKHEYTHTRPGAEAGSEPGGLQQHQIDNITEKHGFSSNLTKHCTSRSNLTELHTSRSNLTEHCTFRSKLTERSTFRSNLTEHHTSRRRLELG
ncbi:unnamed protein product, partial [Lampetra fluviatilis]